MKNHIWFLLNIGMAGLVLAGCEAQVSQGAGQEEGSQGGELTSLGLKLGESPLRVGSEGEANEWNLRESVTAAPYVEYQWPSTVDGNYEIFPEMTMGIGCTESILNFTYTWVDPSGNSHAVKAMESFKLEAGKNYVLQVLLVNYTGCMGAQHGFRVVPAAP